MSDGHHLDLDAITMVGPLVDSLYPGSPRPSPSCRQITMVGPLVDSLYPHPGFTEPSWGFAVYCKLHYEPFLFGIERPRWNNRDPQWDEKDAAVRAQAEAERAKLMDAWGDGASRPGTDE